MSTKRSSRTSLRSKRIGQLLQEAGAVSVEHISRALRIQERQGGLLGRILVNMGACDEKALAQALTRQFNVTDIDIRQVQIAPALAQLVSREVCEKYRLIPFERIGGLLCLAMANPLNRQASTAIEDATQLKVKPFKCPWPLIQDKISGYFGGARAEQAAADKREEGVEYPESGPEVPAAVQETVAAATGAETGVDLDSLDAEPETILADQRGLKAEVKPPEEEASFPAWGEKLATINVDLEQWDPSASVEDLGSLSLPPAPKAEQVELPQIPHASPPVEIPAAIKPQALLQEPQLPELEFFQRGEEGGEELGQAVPQLDDRLGAGLGEAEAPLPEAELKAPQEPARGWAVAKASALSEEELGDIRRRFEPLDEERLQAIAAAGGPATFEELEAMLEAGPPPKMVAENWESLVRTGVPERVEAHEEEDEAPPVPAEAFASASVIDDLPFDLPAPAVPMAEADEEEYEESGMIEMGRLGSGMAAEASAAEAEELPPEFEPTPKGPLRAEVLSESEFGALCADMEPDPVGEWEWLSCAPGPIAVVAADKP